MRTNRTEEYKRFIVEHIDQIIKFDDVLTYLFSSIRLLDDDVLLLLVRAAISSSSTTPNALLIHFPKEVLVRSRQNHQLLSRVLNDRLLKEIRAPLAYAYLSTHIFDKDNLTLEGSAIRGIAEIVLDEIATCDLQRSSAVDLLARAESAKELNIRRVEDVLGLDSITLMLSFISHRMRMSAALLKLAVKQNHAAAPTMIFAMLLATGELKHFLGLLRLPKSGAIGRQINLGFELVGPVGWRAAFTEQPELTIVGAGMINDVVLRKIVFDTLENLDASVRLDLTVLAGYARSPKSIMQLICTLDAAAPNTLRRMLDNLKQARGSKSAKNDPNLATLRLAVDVTYQNAATPVDLGQLSELLKSVRGTEFWDSKPVLRMREAFKEKVRVHLFEPLLRDSRTDPKTTFQQLSEAIVTGLQIAYKREEFDKCGALARELIASGQHRGEYYRYAILSAGKQQRFDQGLQLAQQAISALGQDPVNITWKIRCASAAGDYNLASGLLATELEKDAPSSQVLATLSDFLWMRGDADGTYVAANYAFELGSKSSKKLVKRMEHIAATLGTKLPALAADKRGRWLRDRLASVVEHVQGRLIEQILKSRTSGRERSLGHCFARQPRRVAIVGMHLGIGGAPQKAIRLARALATGKYGLEHVYFFCPEARSNAAETVIKELESDGVTIVIFGAESSISEFPESSTASLTWLQPSRRKKLVEQLATQLLRHKIDTIHAIGTNEIQVQAGLAAALAEIPLCVLNPGMMRPTLYMKKDVSRDEARVYGSFFRSVSKDPRYVIVNNSVRAALDYIDWLSLGLMDIGVLRNGIDVADFPLSRSRARAQLGIDQAENIVLLVGRIAHEKRPDLALEVLRLIADRSPGKHKFVFVGDGPLRKWLEEEATQRGLGDRISVTGFVPDPRSYYEAADICLLISEAEGLPNVVLEAQSFGLPVVTTDAGGAREAVVPGVSGFVVESLEPEPIADALVKLLDDPQLRSAMGKAARAYVNERYTMQRMAETARQIYAGGQPAAADIWRHDLCSFGAPAEWPGGTKSIVEKSNRLAEHGGISAARRMLRWAMRTKPDVLEFWEALIGLETRTARLPRSRLLYRNIIQRAVSDGRMSADTAAEALCYLGQEPLDSGLGHTPIGRRAQDLALFRQSWRQLVDFDASTLKTPAARNAMKLIAQLAVAGIEVADGESPLTALLRKAIEREVPRHNSAGSPRREGACLWIGNLGLGGGERQILLLLHALQRPSLGSRVDLLVDERTSTENSYVGSHLPIVIKDYDHSKFHHPDELIDTALLSFEDALMAKGVGGLRKFTAYLADRRPALIQIRGIAENAILAAIGAVLAGVPRIIINVGTMLHSRQSDGSIAADSTYKRNLGVLSLLASLPQVSFIYNSAAAMRDWSAAMHVPPNSKNVIYNAFDMRELEGELPDAASESLEKIRALRHAGNVIVLGVFRFHNVKRPLRWADVAIRVAKARPDVHFAIVGDGRLLPEFQTRIASENLHDRVTYFGLISSGLSNVYSNSDFLLHTAESESSPNVAIEAQAFGLPVIALDVGGIRELVVPGRTARLQTWQGPNALSKLLIDAIDDDEFRAAAHASGPSTVAERFNLRRMASEFVAIYGEAESVLTEPAE